jgi:hypothetical protein
MARIGEDRRIHRIEPAPAVPDTPEPLTRPARAPEPDTPVTVPATPDPVPDRVRTE